MLKIRIGEIFKTSKYLNSIYLLITTMVFFLVTVFSLLLYFNIEKYVLQNDYQQSRKILSNIKYNIEYIDETIRNLCMSLYFNWDTQLFMMQKDIDTYDLLMKKSNLVSSVINTNSFMHSVYIYNNKNKTYYTTDDNIFYNDTMLEETISSMGEIPKMRPVLRRIRTNNPVRDSQYEDVFSYFLYNSMDGNGRMNGGVIVNIKANWLFDNIKTVNMVDEKNREDIFVLNDDMEFVESGQEKALSGSVSFKNSLREVYTNHLRNSKNRGEDVNFFTANIGNESYAITYIRLAKARWTLVKVQPHDQVYKYISRLKSSIVLITLIFLLPSVIICISVSKRIYRPIGNLVKQTLEEGPESSMLGNTRDEITYLNDLIKDSKDRLRQFQSEKNTNREIIKNYYLTKLLMDSYSIQADEFSRVSEEYDISLSIYDPIVICIIRIDGYREFEQKYSSSDRELFKFAITNILTEILSEKYPSETIDMKNEQIVLLLNANVNAEDFYSQLTLLIRKAQEHAVNYFKLYFSISISNILEDFRETTRYYNLALNNSAYRYIFGRMCVISPANIHQDRENLTFEYPAFLERKIVEEIKAGNIQSIDDVLLKFLVEISRFNYRHIMLSVMQILNTIQVTVDELNQARLKPIHLNFTNIYQRLYELETIDELYVRIMDIFKSITIKEGRIDNEKHTALADAIRKIVNENYFNKDLCLPNIAATLRMSPVTVSRIFRECVEMSITEYISEVRLNKALEWLEVSSLNINQIAEKVGIEGESYFYRLFKKKFGMTPKEYVLKKVVKGQRI